VIEPLTDAEIKAWDSFSAEEIKVFAEAMIKYTVAFENALKDLGIK
jgi:galactose-1-phosphate uridylyltransferase